MKKFICDACGNEFDPGHGMVEGWYDHTRKIQWANPDNSVKIIKVRKTISLIKDTPEDEKRPAGEHTIKLDICRSCIPKFEKP